MHLTKVRSVKRNIISGANSFIMCQPMFLQLICPLPFQEIKTVVAGLLYEHVELLRRQHAYSTQWMYPDAEQHFIFDDITHARENALCEQRITHQHLRHLF